MDSPVLSSNVLRPMYLAGAFAVLTTTPAVCKHASDIRQTCKIARQKQCRLACELTSTKPKRWMQRMRAAQQAVSLNASWQEGSQQLLPVCRICAVSLESMPALSNIAYCGLHFNQYRIKLTEGVRRRHVAESAVAMAARRS